MPLYKLTTYALRVGAMAEAPVTSCDYLSDALMPIRRVRQQRSLNHQRTSRILCLPCSDSFQACGSKTSRGRKRKNQKMVRRQTEIHPMRPLSLLRAFSKGAAIPGVRYRVCSVGSRARRKINSARTNCAKASSSSC
jgi:hypothetical protein